MRSVLLLILLGSSAACFDPSFRAGLSCSERDRCPPGQTCTNGFCHTSVAADSDGGASRDGAPDAAPCVATALDDTTCDGIDDDCDDQFDEDAGDSGIFYRDLDGDGFGDGASATSACEQPTGYVAMAGDCWDSTAPEAGEAFPGQGTYVGHAAGGGTMPFDWNCDGTIEYQETTCVDLEVQDERCEDYSQAEGWTGLFPDCGVADGYCTAWDIYKDGCYGSELRTQGCL